MTCKNTKNSFQNRGNPKPRKRDRKYEKTSKNWPYLTNLSVPNYYSLIALLKYNHVRYVTLVATEKTHCA